MKIEQKLIELTAKKAQLIEALKAKAVEIEKSVDDEDKYAAAEKAYNDIEAELAEVSAEKTAAEAKKADLMARAKRVEDLVGSETQDEEKSIMQAPMIKKFGHEKGADYAGAPIIRRLMAQVTAKQHGVNVVDMAKHLFPNDSRVHALVTRAPVPIPTTVTPGQGDVLVVEHNAQQELVDLLRNELVYTRMPGTRTIPLPANRGSVRIPRTTSAVSAGWVGEGQSIGVSNASFDSFTISPYKIGTIVLSTREMLERSDPSLEQILRNQIVTSVAEAIDRTFYSDVAGTATSPAGIFDGLAPLAAAGVLPAAPTAQQVINYLNAFKLQSMLSNMGNRSWAWVMHPSTMVGLMSLRSSIDTMLFPELSAGQLMGYPVISVTGVPAAMPVSGSKIISFIDATEIFYGIGDGVNLATSDNAYVQSDTTPATGPVNGVSLWQQELIGIRATHDVSWARRRDQAIIYAETLL